MKNRYFYILWGTNGATYLLNTKNWIAICNSLKFYKARSFKQRSLKTFLKIYLYILGFASQKISLGKLKTKDEVTNYLNKKIERNNNGTLGKHSDEKLNFSFDDNCSALFSPTKDKIIIHHHDMYFQKFAFGDSYLKVQNEASIYNLLLEKKLLYFSVSNIDTISKEEHFFSFKMHNDVLINNGTDNNTSDKKLDLVPALVELFNSSPKRITQTSSEYLLKIQAQYNGLNNSSDKISKLINTLKKQLKEQNFPLGLVHRDFKPWNISYEKNQLLIYDFEEATIDALPLEDLFNYYIDPEIRYKNSEEVASMIIQPNMVNLYKRYLKKLNLNINFKDLLYIYLLERSIFWLKANELDTSNRLTDLLSLFLYEPKQQ